MSHTGGNTAAIVGLGLGLVGLVVIVAAVMLVPRSTTGPTPPPDGWSPPPPGPIESEPAMTPIGDEVQVIETSLPDIADQALVMGTPDGIHAAFDVDNVRLALVWRGGFIDAEGTIQSDDRLNMPPGPAFAALSDPNDTWPLDNDTFGGVAFDRHTVKYTGIPTFEYELLASNVRIYETVTPFTRDELDGGGSGVRRRLVVKRPGGFGVIWHRAIVGAEIVETDDAFVIDDRITVAFSRRMIGFGDPPVIRERSDGLFELLIPFFDPTDSREQHEMLDVEIVW